MFGQRAAVARFTPARPSMKIARTLPVDISRLGIAGWKLWRYMTMWAVTQTRRFRAAVAGAGISNWQSSLRREPHRPVDDSVFRFHGLRQPHRLPRAARDQFCPQRCHPDPDAGGDSDAECPAPQSYEFWHALKTRGVKNAARGVSNEGHAIRRPEHVEDILSRTIAWFDTNLAPHLPAPKN